MTKNASHLLALSALAVGCASSPPIEPTTSSKSHFADAVYKGSTVKVKDATPGAETFRVFIQGSSGFVPISSVREDAEQRATQFCERKDRAMESLIETTANPPYILGNYPRIEIVFDCIAKPRAAAPPSMTLDQCFARCRELTPRTEAECFDTCRH
jgi:hypothetical protein